MEFISMNTNANVADGLEEVVEELNRQELSKREEQYQTWCDSFASLPEDSGRKLKDGFIAHVELQPQRWIQHGLDLMGSRKGFGTIRLLGCQQGPDFRAYLPYPVFQMGTEIFLKGMWLYQHDECRILKADTYIALERREHYLKELKDLFRSHDLLVIIRQVESINVYAQDAWVSRFLKIVGGISKTFYLPVTNSKYPWADERYPKRFYKDSSQISAADAYQSYPEHWPIARLFAEAADRIDFLWRARTGIGHA